MSGGLAGVARYAGGSLAQAIYTSVLANTQSFRAAVTLPRAAIAAGATETTAAALRSAFPLGCSSARDSLRHQRRDPGRSQYGVPMELCSWHEDHCSIFAFIRRTWTCHVLLVEEH